MKVSVLSKATALGLLLTVAAGVAGAETAEEVLARLEPKYDALTSIQSLTTQSMRGPVGSQDLTQKTWLSRDGGTAKFRMEAQQTAKFQGMEQSGSSIQVVDGQTLWVEMVNNGEKSVLKGEPPKAEELSQYSGIRELMKMGEFQVGEDETINGEPCAKLLLTGPAQPDANMAPPSFKVWLSENTGLLIKLEATDPGGVMTVTTSDIKLNEAIDPSVFTYTPPEGVAVQEIPSSNPMAAPSEAAPVESAPVEAAPVEKAPEAAQPAVAPEP